MPPTMLNVLFAIYYYMLATTYSLLSTRYQVLPTICFLRYTLYDLRSSMYYLRSTTGSVYHKTYFVLASPWEFHISGPQIRNLGANPGAGFKNSGMNKKGEQKPKTKQTENRGKTCPESSDFDENPCGGRCFARRIFLAGSRPDLAADENGLVFFISFFPPCFGGRFIQASFGGPGSVRKFAF